MKDEKPSAWEDSIESLILIGLLFGVCWMLPGGW